MKVARRSITIRKRSDAADYHHGQDGERFRHVERIRHQRADETRIKASGSTRICRADAKREYLPSGAIDPERCGVPSARRFQLVATAA